MKTNPFAGTMGGTMGGPDCVMKINGLTCTLNMPKTLKQHFGADMKEVAQGLPPYAQRKAFVVDEYPACPDNWIRGSATEASYFVPVLGEHGLWLDFNNNHSHTHHVAVLISIQGINAITGQKTDKMRLEQYRTKCPIHNIDFGHERYCKQCGYKWDAQNYLAGNATPRGYLWLDGFRAEDGVTRQFVFTKEEMRGIAAQIIGQDRVFAIGIAFFLSKELKPAPVVRRETLRSYATLDDLSSPDLIGAHFGSDPSRVLFGAATQKSLNSRTLTASFERVNNSGLKKATLEIAAGAKIDQRVFPDPEELTFWQEKPAGVIYINYVDETLAREIIEAGKIDMTAGGEGFLQNLKVGNPA